MSPLLTRERLGWLLLAWSICALAATLLLREAGWSWMESVVVGPPLVAVHLLACGSSWFISGFAPLRRGPPSRLFAATLLAALLAGALWVQLASLYGTILAQTTSLGNVNERIAAIASPLGAAGVLLYFCFGLLAFLDSEQRAVREAREAALRGVTLAREAELVALRAQINPHFLFNSLHSISALVGIDKDRARETCALLGDFLRLSLGIGDRRFIPLREELDLVDRYLRIEQVRYQRFRLERTIAEDAREVPVPPLLLQPLVENAIRHGVATLTGEGCIALEAHTIGNHLVIRVANDYDPETPSRSGAGVGLENVRRRLRNLYGGGARLDTNRNDGLFRAEIYLLTKPPEVPL